MLNVTENAQVMIDKSGTGIGKTGTGIGKSGTGIGKSGTGISPSRWLQMALLTAPILAPLSVGAAGLQVSEHDGLISVSMHEEGKIIAAQASIADNRTGYLAIPMIAVTTGTDADRINFHGSGSGAPQFHGSGSGAPQFHGSGSGAPQFHGSGSGAPQFHGSGSGAPQFHGSGSGAPQFHGSGSGSPSSDFEQDGKQTFACTFTFDQGLMFHGSGSGAPQFHGSGSGSPEAAKDGVMFHGSGSGSPESAESNCFGTADLWGFAEVAFDASGISIIVHRLTAQGLEEHSLAFRSFKQAGRLTDDGKVGLNAN